MPAKSAGSGITQWLMCEPVTCRCLMSTSSTGTVVVVSIVVVVSMAVSDGQIGRSDRTVIDRDDTRQISEGTTVGAHDGATSSRSGRGDDQVVRASWPSGLAHRDEQGSMSHCHRLVVGEHRHRFDDLVDICLAGGEPWQGGLRP